MFFDVVETKISRIRRGIVRFLSIDKPVFDDLRLLLGSIVVPWAEPCLVVCVSVVASGLVLQ